MVVVVMVSVSVAMVVVSVVAVMVMVRPDRLDFLVVVCVALLGGTETHVDYR